MTTPPHLLRRLDYCPTWLALPLGLGIGALFAVAVLLWTPAVLGTTLFVLLLGGAALLASSGEPVAARVRAPEPEPALEPLLPGEVAVVVPEPEPRPEPEPVPTLLGLEMVRIPGGVFRMGSLDQQPGSSGFAQPGSPSARRPGGRGAAGSGKGRVNFLYSKPTVQSVLVRAAGTRSGLHGH